MLIHSTMDLDKGDARGDGYTLTFIQPPHTLTYSDPDTGSVTHTEGNTDTHLKDTDGQLDTRTLPLSHLTQESQVIYKSQKSLEILEIQNIS